jgi:hypothetical protein
MQGMNWTGFPTISCIPRRQFAQAIADDSSRDYKKKIGPDGKETWVVDP